MCTQYLSQQIVGDALNCHVTLLIPQLRNAEPMGPMGPMGQLCWGISPFPWQELAAEGPWPYSLSP